MNQSVIDHIRNATPKGTRNHHRTHGHHRNLLGSYLLHSAAGAGIIGLSVIIYFIASK